MRRFLLLASILALSMPPLVARYRQDSAPQFRASADIVTVDAAVRRNGRPVTDLKVTEFEVLDNGVRQAITDLSYGKLPIDVTVALDVSGSVTGQVLDDLRRSVQQLARDLRPGDRLKLLTFNMRVTRMMDFAEDVGPGVAAIRQSRGSGSTAVLDTIAVALNAPASPDRRHLIMLFTDGQDSSSITDPDTLIDLAHRTTPTVGVVLAPPTIGMSFTSSSGATTLRVPTPLALREFDAARQFAESLAKETGGQVVVGTTGGTVASSLRRLLDEFRSSYVLRFTPSGVERGGVHTLSVRVMRSGGSAYDVRARSSYAWR